jgi:hypothetical protein
MRTPCQIFRQTNEKALSHGQHRQCNMPGPVTVPDHWYFVMRDTRTYSEDGRFFGPIPPGADDGPCRRRLVARLPS